MSDPDTPDLSPIVSKAAWERLEGESEQDYGRYLVYNADRRTRLSDVAQSLGLSYEHIRRIAKKHRWRARREAYYLEEDIEMRRAIKERTARHAEELTAGWRALSEWAMDSIAEHRAEGRSLSPRDANQALKTATDALRLLDGKTTSNVGVGLAEASDAQLAELENLLKNLDIEDE